MDWSKGAAIHRLYGHTVFAIEAAKRGKDDRFLASVCVSQKCTKKAPDWRDHLDLVLF